MAANPADPRSGLAAAAPPPAGSVERRVAPRSGRRAEARSLFGEILDWMFAPLLLLWPMSVSITYLVAQSIASTPFDRALVDRGEALAAHVRFEAGHARFDSTPGLLEIYGNGVGEAGTYQVVDETGSVLAGDRDLPRPHEVPAPGGDGAALNGAFALRDETLRGHPVRVATAWVAAPNAAAGGGLPAALVQVAESPAERTQLANEIVKGVILPQFVVLPLALLLVWFGLTRGLAPLARLQRTIRGRTPDDLSPISTDAAPEEITPLLASFNDLLGRMSHNLDVQKRFIADAAHQMKTPLAGLRTQAELAQREGNAQELQRSLRQIAESTERATRLINQLLALARAEHGAGESGAVVPLDLDQLARSVVQDWVPQALAQHIDLGYEGPPDDAYAHGHAVQGYRVLGAPMLLREMLNNLVDNALRYCASSDGGGTVTVRVLPAGTHVVVEVEDSGPGVPPEERERIFERFYRVLGSRQDGSGLGLAIVREIVAQHGGAVQVTDGHAGPTVRGALFRVTLRAAAPQ